MNNMNLLEVRHAACLDGGADSRLNVEQLATKIMNFNYKICFVRFAIKVIR